MTRLSKALSVDALSLDALNLDALSAMQTLYCMRELTSHPHFRPVLSHPAVSALPPPAPAALLLFRRQAPADQAESLAPGRRRVQLALLN